MVFTGTGKLVEPANVTRRPVVPGQGSDGALYISDSIGGRG